MAGVWVWGVAAAVGVSAILLASATAYTVVRYLGAAYLIYLGVRMVVEAHRAGGLALATIHNLLVLVWFTVVIFLTNLATNFFAKPRVGQTMEYLAGAALFGFGVTMALERA